MKKFFSIFAPLFAIFIIIGGTYYYLNSGNKTVKAEYDKYINDINDNYNFENGLKGLESLNTEKSKEVIKNLNTEITIATELKNIEDYINGFDIDNAKESLEKVKSLDTENKFNKAISWFEQDITNFDKASEEINNLNVADSNYNNEVKSVLNKYSFNHKNLKSYLDTTSDEFNTLTNNSNNNKSTAKNTKSNSKTTISDEEIHPQIFGQQVEETYYDLRYTEKGKVSRNIVETELRGDIENFTNEQINQAISSYNKRMQD